MNGSLANHLPSIFEDGDVYDLVLNDLSYSLDFYVGLARNADGPVLDDPVAVSPEQRPDLPRLRVDLEREGVILHRARALRGGGRGVQRRPAAALTGDGGAA